MGFCSYVQRRIAERMKEKSMSKQPKVFYKDWFGQVHNSLFSPGPNDQLNACVGRNGDRQDFTALLEATLRPVGDWWPACEKIRMG